MQKKRLHTVHRSTTLLVVLGDVHNLRAGLRIYGQLLQLRLLRLFSGRLRLHRIQFGKKRVGHRLFMLDELFVDLNIGLILDGLQNGLLFRHLRRLDNRELRRAVLHGKARNRRRLLHVILLRILRVLLLQIRHLHENRLLLPLLFLSSSSDESGGRSAAMRAPRLTRISSSIWKRRSGVSVGRSLTSWRSLTSREE